MATTVLNYETSVQDKLSFFVSQAEDWALSHGILMRSPNFLSSSDVVTYLPFAVFPSVLPKSVYDEAKDIQTEFNLLMHKVAHDYEFLRNTLKSVIASDEFTRNLWDIYESVYNNNQNQKRLCLGLFRSDYMLHCAQNDFASSNQLQLKQIEFNTIASGYAGPVQNMVSLHRYTLSLLKLPIDEEKIPENKCNDGFAIGMVQAWKLYGKPEAIILFMVPSKEKNIFDQRWLEYGVFKFNPRIIVLRSTFENVHDHGHLDEDNNLIVSGYEVAVVYFRCGYAPSFYKTQKDWDVKKMIECSNAIKSPSINYCLAGTKKIQQELSQPGVLEKYVPDPQKAQRLRNTFAKQYSLEMGPEGDEIINMALKNPDYFVLKPQREGGGNNFFGEQLQKELERVKDSVERTSFILMERVFPLPQRNLLIFPQKPKVFNDTITELGIYGVMIGDSDQVLYNEEVGHLLRTKTTDTDDGGVSAGYAALDTPYFI